MWLVRAVDNPRVSSKQRSRTNSSHWRPRSNDIAETLPMIKFYRKNRSFAGFMVGILVMVVTWFCPLPVIAIVSLFRIDHPFGDVMLMCIPLFISVPFVGALIRSFVSRE